MQPLPVGVIGASGYSGVEATRILALHPRVELRLAASDRARSCGA
jgi:N-acetyl-gamma-glutamyl-phosphate reductase